ncbi:MAG: hypothetical protein AAF919_09425 [Pseudomonadota bacterium]
MRLEPLAVILAVSACNSEVGTQVTQAAARSVVNAEMERRFPGAPTAPVTDCVIANATSEEIITVATAAATGPDERTAQTISTVLRRPDTIRCVATEGLSDFLGRPL